MLTGAYHVIRHSVKSETFITRHFWSLYLIQTSIRVILKSVVTPGAAENGVPEEIADGISQVHVHFLPSPQSFLFTSCHSFSPRAAAQTAIG